MATLQKIIQTYMKKKVNNSMIFPDDVYLARKLMKDFFLLKALNVSVVSLLRIKRAREKEKEMSSGKGKEKGT